MAKIRTHALMHYPFRSRASSLILMIVKRVNFRTVDTKYLHVVLCYYI